MRVFVLDTNRKPLDPTTPARARWLLKQQRAAVFRCYPFTIILKYRTLEKSEVHKHRVKIDPGSKVTGLAVVQDETAKIVFAAELAHRGTKIKASLDLRSAIRHNRRQRKTRYRKTRFDNRRRPEGWLPPSLESRIANVRTWVNRLRRFCPVAAISVEFVRFDTRAMQNPGISGPEYRQGTLAGYEIREYLLEKWGRKCAYCGKEGVPLQIEHIQPRSRGGTDRVSNLTLACTLCNQRKDNRLIEDFLKRKPEILEHIKSQVKIPLKDATAINVTRWKLLRQLRATGLPVECGSGGRTKFNRIRLGLPKTHWLDAACVGESTPDNLAAFGVRPLRIKACGHGKRNRCWTNKHGFPIRHAPRKKFVKGFRTGDIVIADIPSGKYQGRHVGRVTIRAAKGFALEGHHVGPQHLRVIHKADGYDYSTGDRFACSTQD